MAWAAAEIRPAALASPATAPGESPPRVRVLGTVQDGGLPHAGCHCQRCERARQDPHARRWIASLALIFPDRGKVYLLDATPDLREQLAALTDVRQPPPDRVDRAPLAGVFLTHAHIGHYLGLAFFGFEAIHTQGLPVFCTPRMASFLRQNGPWSQLVDLGNIAVQEIGAAGVMLEERVRVQALPVPHRDEFSDTVAFKLSGPQKTLLYVPDTDAWHTWNPSLREILVGVDFALLDGTFYSLDELPGRDITQVKHPLIRDSMTLLAGVVPTGAAQETPTTQVFFTHLNHSNPALDPESAARREITSRGFAVLAEGQEFAL